MASAASATCGRRGWASRRRCRSLTCGWCWRSMPWRAAVLPLVRCGAGSAAGGAAVLAGLGVPGEVGPHALCRAGRRCTGCWASRPTACSARRCCRRDAQPRRTADAACHAGAAPWPGHAAAAAERLTFRFVGAGFAWCCWRPLLLGAWSRAPGAGTTRRCSRCSAGWCSPRCLAGGAARSAGAGRWPRAGSTRRLLLLLAYVGSRFVLEVVCCSGRPRLKPDAEVPCC